MEGVPQSLLDFITRGKKFLIAGHKEPDGDCIGSQFALASALKRLGKEVILLSAGPFKRTEINRYADQFLSAIDDKEREGARAIIVDCSEIERVGEIQTLLAGLPLAIIDHHATNTSPDSPNAPLFLDPKAPSATFLIAKLIEALGLSLTGEEAEFLFFGLCTDTGFFRHIDQTGSETFYQASRLIAAGANPKTTFNAINGGKSLDSRRLMGLVLSRAKPYYGGKLIVSSEKYEETKEFGAEGRDSDSLYQLFQSVAGVEAIAIIRQEKPDNCTVGLRSRDKINVAEVALQFGGGGHKNASGITISGIIDDLEPRIIKAFEAQLG
jgi:phosphoesterase RecJ-like protein